PAKPAKLPATTLSITDSSFEGTSGVLGIIGAGNFTKMTMLPALKKANASIKTIASSGGLSGTTLAKKYGIAQSTTDYQSILQDEEIDAVMITTRHNSHAPLIVESLKSAKHVFVEKPLAINREQLDDVTRAYQELPKPSNASITVGYNRRFSPHIQAIKKALGKDPGVMNINATMNAGFIPRDVWVHDMQVGGGRIIGEACHYIDLCIYLTGSLITTVCMNAMGTSPEENTDNASILLRFE